MNEKEIFNKANEAVDNLIDGLAKQPWFGLLGLDANEVKRTAKGFISEVETKVNEGTAAAKEGGVKVDGPATERGSHAKYPPFNQMVSELKAAANEYWGTPNGWTDWNPLPEDSSPIFKALGYQSNLDFVKKVYEDYLKGDWPNNKVRKHKGGM